MYTAPRPQIHSRTYAAELLKASQYRRTSLRVLAPTQIEDSERPGRETCMRASTGVHGAYYR